jgi:hypothetical protein
MLSCGTTTPLVAVLAPSRSGREFSGEMRERERRE